MCPQGNRSPLSGTPRVILGLPGLSRTPLLPPASFPTPWAPESNMTCTQIFPVWFSAGALCGPKQRTFPRTSTPHPDSPAHPMVQMPRGLISPLAHPSPLPSPTTSHLLPQKSLPCTAPPPPPPPPIPDHRRPAPNRPPPDQTGAKKMDF